MRAGKPSESLSSATPQCAEQIATHATSCSMRTAVVRLHLPGQRAVSSKYSIEPEVAKRSWEPSAAPIAMDAPSFGFHTSTNSAVTPSINRAPECVTCTMKLLPMLEHNTEGESTSKPATSTCGVCAHTRPTNKKHQADEGGSSARRH